MRVSLLFPQHWTKFGPNFAPRPHPIFFCFPMKYVRDSIYINKFNWNQLVLKKFAKTSKNYHFLAQPVQKGLTMGHTQNKKTFFLQK